MKNRAKQGFTLIEMLVALLIMVFLILGMGVGMDAGSRIYQDATFESDSATLAGILNTSLGDILRYSINTKYQGAPEDSVHHLTDEEKEKLEQAGQADSAENNAATIEFIFTSLEYGIQDAYFYTPVADGTYMGVLQMRNLRNANTVDLINTGAYPNLVITNFKITYKPRTNPGIEGGYFYIEYDIYSATNLDKTRHVEYIVRQMND